jgi:ABC-type antimicrobial peptide transport system permease subunit
MRISDLLIMGLRNLSRRKARTFLTVFGVVIGSLSIIIMRSIGYGMENNFRKQLMEQGGMTMITVSSRAQVVDENSDDVNLKKQVIDNRLVEQINNIKHVRAVSPVINVDVSIESHKYMGFASISVMNSEVFDDFDFPALAYGEYPTQENRSVIVFGSDQPYVYEKNKRKGGGEQPDIDFEKEKFELSFEGENYKVSSKKREFALPLKNVAKLVETRGTYDWNAYMDLQYFEKVYTKYCNTLELTDRRKAIKKLNEYDQLQLNVDNIDNVSKVQEEIKQLGYESYSDMSYIEPVKKTSDTLQMVLGALGFVAMFVSAISIANTMVMSIYERTKEIGVMKVLGCVIRDIRKLFLFEAGMIGFLGGAIGIILGYIASFLINKFGQPIFGSLMSGNYMLDEMENTSFSIIPFYLPFGALAISIGVGLLSGYFPAKRATKISAIEAMKTEG